MPATNAFTDFMAKTGPVFVTGPETLINEAVKNSYVLDRFLRGRDLSEIVQGGDTIQDIVMFDESNSFSAYQPNDELSYSMPQHQVTQTGYWRYFWDHMAYTDQEIELNVPSGLSLNAAMVKYKDMRKGLEVRLQTSIVNGMEANLWTAPDGAAAYAGMEGVAGTQAYSIPAFVTEASEYHHDNWVNVLGINPETNEKWRNQVENYTYANLDTELIEAFHKMWLKVRFKSPPPLLSGVAQDVFTQDLISSRQTFIAASLLGITKYSEVLRNSNDTLMSAQDPAYHQPKYGGLDMVHVSHLDTLTLDWDNGQTAATEANYNTPGPRYWWLNTKYLKPIYHARRYFNQKAPFSPSKQPWSHIVPVDVWYNLWCSSRNRQGIVAPS